MPISNNALNKSGNFHAGLARFQRMGWGSWDGTDGLDTDGSMGWNIGFLKEHLDPIPKVSPG